MLAAAPGPRATSDTARMQRVLRWIIWPSYIAILGGALLYLGLGISQRPELTILFHGVGLVVVAVAHVLTERGRVRLAADLLMVLFFFIYTAAAGLSGGTNSPYMGGFILVVVGAALLRGGTAGLVAAGCSLVVSCLFTAADATGTLPPSLMPLTPAFNLIAWILFIGMTSVLLKVTVGELQGALQRAESTERTLQDTLQDLHRTSVSKASVEGVLLGLGDAVFVLDAQDRIRDVNPQAERLLDEPRSSLIGTAFSDWVQQGSTQDGRAEGALQRRSGTVHVSMSRASIHGVQGELDGVVVVAHDIQDRVAAEERTRIAAVQAQANSHAKSHFLATMSHELRTPLNAIIGYSEFVQEVLEDSSELQADVERIERSGRDLLALINDVLDLSKIEAGRVQLEICDVSIPALVNDVGTQLAPLFQRNGNTLDVCVAPNVTQARTDPTRLRQILRNLLSNATKFTERGSIVLGVSSDGDWLRFEVADTGLGMTPDQLNMIWEPFAQADASTTRRYGGTGLGLPITRHLCELLGGSIEVSSVAGQGTRFVARLPARHASDLS